MTALIARMRYIASLPWRQWLRRAAPDLEAEECDLCGQTVWVPVERAGRWTWHDDRMAEAVLAVHDQRAGHLLGGDPS